MASPGSLFREHWRSPYGRSNSQLLYSRAKASLDVVQRLKIETKLEVHNGCVNTICWNEVGTCILSGSDDQHLCITDPFTKKKITSITSGHFANIFSAKFLPNTRDNQIISCSGDGMIQYTIVDRPDQHGHHAFDCHFGTTYEIVTVPQDCNTFLSCGEDGTVRWFDLRIKDKCNKEECKEDILINCRRAVTALAINPIRPYQLSVGCSDSTVRIFDRRMLGTRATGNYTGRSNLTGMMSRFTAPLLEGHSHRITSLSYSTDGVEVLASYSSEQIYLFNLNEDSRKELSADVTKTPYEQKKAPAAEASTSSSSPRHPPIKRLRLRGDWSDTGPNARPERERAPANASPGQAEAEGADTEPQPAEEGAAVAEGPAEAAPAAETEPRSVTIMQRMSDMLTRWLEGASRQADQQRGSARPQPAAHPGGDPANPQEEQPAQEEAQGSGPPGSAEGTGEAGGAESEGQGAPGGSTQASGGPQEEHPQQPPNETRDNVTGVQGGDESEAAENRGEPDQKESEDKKTLPKADEATASGVQSQSVIEKEGVELAETSQTRANVEVDGNDTQSDKPVESDKQSDKQRVEVQGTSGSGSQPPLGQNKTVGIDEPVGQSRSLGQAQSVGQPQSMGQARPMGQGQSMGQAQSMGQVQSMGQAQSTGSTLEPLVSLRYTPEGTSTGTIRVDFPTSGTEGGPNLPPDVSDYQSVPTSDRGSTGEKRSKVTSNPTGSTSDEGARSNVVPVDSPNMADIDNETANMSISNSDTESAKAMDCARPQTASPKRSEGDQDEMTSSKESDTCYIPPENKIIYSGSDSDNEDVQASAEGEHKPESSQAESVPGEAQGTSSASPSEGTSADRPGGNNDMPRRLASANQGSGSSTQRPSSGRQRRHGHSGPPTGDFQLHSPSDDDSDTEDIQSRRRDDMERNLAALRLQELYRKRQEEREREEQQMLNIHQPGLKHVYSGHRNARTMIKEATFWGEQFVMSGSDCGHIFFWDRYTSELVMVLEADKHVVNCLQPHPFDPILASSGIDYDIKLWMPTEENPNFDEEKASEVVQRNRVMLEETRDTITVPASFMLRMLASLNHIRAGRRQGDGSSNSSSSDEE